MHGEWNDRRTPESEGTDRKERQQWTEKGGVLVGIDLDGGKDNFSPMVVSG